MREQIEANHKCVRPKDIRVVKNRQEAGCFNNFYGGWHLFRIMYDLEYEFYYHVDIGEIKFCPWCGKKLEECKPTPEEREAAEWQ